MIFIYTAVNVIVVAVVVSVAAAILIQQMFEYDIDLFVCRFPLFTLTRMIEFEWRVCAPFFRMYSIRMSIKNEHFLLCSLKFRSPLFELHTFFCVDTVQWAPLGIFMRYSCA